MVQTRLGRASYHHGDLPNALADAATELARSGGPEAVVLREAARRVGVSAAAAYRHYASHCELLQEVRHRAVAALADALQAGVDRGEPLPDPADEALRRFRNLGSAYVGFALSDPGLFHASFVNHSPYCRVETIPADVGEKIAASRPYQILADSLDELVGAGILDAARREVAPIAFWSAVHALARWSPGRPGRAAASRGDQAHPGHPRRRRSLPAAFRIDSGSRGYRRGSDRPALLVLAQRAPSPVPELSRAVAVAMADGPAAGPELAAGLGAPGVLRGYHLLPATWAGLLRRPGRATQAAASCRRPSSWRHRRRAPRPRPRRRLLSQATARPGHRNPFAGNKPSANVDAVYIASHTDDVNGVNITERPAR